MFNELNMIGVVVYMKITMIPIDFLMRVRLKVFMEYNLYMETKINTSKITRNAICQSERCNDGITNGAKGMKINSMRPISMRYPVVLKESGKAMAPEWILAPNRIAIVFALPSLS